MTCIAIRGKTIAADSRLTVCDSQHYSCRKLFRVPDGIIGFTGDTAGGNQLLHHLRLHSCEDPIKLEDYELKDTGALLLTKRGVYCYEDSISPDKITGRFFAIGTGALAALAAMQMGADAVEAVRIACKFDVYCAPPVRWMRLK